MSKLVYLALLTACGRINFAEQSGTSSIDAPSVQGFTRVVAFGDATCAIYKGRAYCWGDNGTGQIGDGTNEPRKVPTLVRIPDALVTTLTIGEAHGCAIAAGALYCWGQGPGLSPTPVQILASASDVAAGRHFTCLVTNGSAQCFGINDTGQLGDGTMAPHNQPAPISMAAPAAAVDAGDDHACMVTTTGEAYCWGHNDFGTLGTGSNNPMNSPAPVRVAGGVATLPKIAGWHACTLEGTQVMCWGRNSEGALGDNTTTSQPTPRAVPSFANATFVATGGGPTDFDATCAIAAGTVYCWGAGSDGRLGTGNAMNALVPMPLLGLPAPALDLALGYAHTCAVLTDGDVWCWGRGDSGQLGDGRGVDSFAPVRVTPPAG